MYSHTIATLLEHCVKLGLIALVTLSKGVLVEFAELDWERIIYYNQGRECEHSFLMRRSTHLFPHGR